MGTAPAITVRSGTTEEWTIENWTNELHAFHIHQVHFRVLEIDGRSGGDVWRCRGGFGQWIGARLTGGARHGAKLIGVRRGNGRRLGCKRPKTMMPRRERERHHKRPHRESAQENSPIHVKFRSKEFNCCQESLQPGVGTRRPLSFVWWIASLPAILAFSSRSHPGFAAAV